MPQLSDKDAVEFRHVWDDECTVSSRLACLINLDKRHDGLVVLIPDPPPVDLI